MNSQQINNGWKRLQNSLVILIVGIAVFLTGIRSGEAQNGNYPVNETTFAQLVSSQNMSDSKLLSIQFANVTLQEALELLAKEVNVGFSYNPDVIPEKKVAFSMTNAPLHEVLYKLLEGTNLEPVLPPTKDVIVIREKEIDKGDDVDLETVSGTVYDATSGESLPGVNILVKGTSTGTSTNLDGFYEITVPTLNDTLVFSYVGYQQQEVPINGMTEFDVELEPQLFRGDELVVTGYSTQSRADLTGSVSVVEMDDFQSLSSEQVTKQMQGLISGVTVTSSGEVGQEATIRIRGLNTFGNNEPLYIVDGVPTKNISTLNSNDIQSMQVLKDASAAAIYGARASNGVVIITTQQARVGEISVSYDGRFSYSVPKQGNPFGIADQPMQLAQIMCQARLNDGNTSPHIQFGDCSNPTIPDYLDPAGAMEGDPSVDPSLYNIQPEYTDPAAVGSFYWITPANKEGTNLYNETFNPAGTMNHNLAVSGGGNIGSYLLSLNYTNSMGTNNTKASEGNQPSQRVGNSLERYNLRVNSSFNLGDNLRIGENLSYTISEFQGGGTLDGSLYWPSVIPVYDLMGNFAGSHALGLGSAQNSVARMWRARNNTDTRHRLFGNIYAELDLLNDMVSLRSSLGGELNNRNQRAIDYPEYERSENTSNNLYSVNISESNELTWTNTANFSLDWEAHSLDFLVGTEVFGANYNTVLGENELYFTLDPNYVSLSTGTGNPVVGSTFEEEYILSYFGDLDYNYSSRYLFGATLRRDGSSKFIDNQWGYFPSFSVGWRITNEEFFPDVSWLTDLKLRGSWGITGNQQNVNRYNGYTTYAGGLGYGLGGSNTSAVDGLGKSRIGAPLAKWERNVGTTFGFDAILFEGGLEATVEYYEKTVDDLLYNPELPGTAGSASAPFINTASMTNKGVDASLTASGSIGSDLRYKSTFTFTAYRNMIKSIVPGVENFQQEDGIIINQVGSPVSSYYGYVIEGFWNSQEEIDEANASVSESVYQQGMGLGHWRYKDVNGDGRITPDDRTILGDPHPDFTYGLNLNLGYKAFDISAFFYGVQGNQVYQQWRWWTDFPGGFIGNKSERALYDSWRPDNQDAAVTRLTYNSSIGTNDAPNDYFIDDGSYLRMKNLQVGYTLPLDISQRVGISNARFYVQATNLFTITKYSGPEPEIGAFGGGETAFGIDETPYPIPREFTIGINITY